MKFSKNFERDYTWMLKYKDIFTFSGSSPKKLETGNQYTAKEAFYIYDSQGKLNPTTEPGLLSEIFLCKEAVNFQIKQWSEDRAKGYLPKIEFQKITEEYELLPWMVNAVENQKYKYYEKKI